MTGMQMMLLGTGGPTVELAGAIVSDFTTDPDDAHVGYRLNSTGVEQQANGDPLSYTDIGDWLISGSAGDYEVRATLNSGTLTTGTTGSFQVLSTTRAWTVQRTIVGIGSANLTIEIRRVGTTTILASASVILTAEVIT